ncbi:MAG: hypothetical protein NC123_15390 [Butyrivibrio sp.]|nr:hypothetical protein [Acetatifactor muris]MCM1560904.1 hypothetical protein [Butyrivibrio sp.]
MALTAYDHILKDIYGELLDLHEVYSVVDEIRRAASKRAVAALLKTLYHGEAAVLRRDVAGITLASGWEYPKMEQEERLKLLRFLRQTFRDHFGGMAFKAFTGESGRWDLWNARRIYMEEALMPVCDPSADPDAKRLDRLYGRKPPDGRRLCIFLAKVRAEAVRDVAREAVDGLYRFGGGTPGEMEGIEPADQEDLIELGSVERQTLLKVLWRQFREQFDRDLAELLNAVSEEQG